MIYNLIIGVYRQLLLLKHRYCNTTTVYKGVWDKNLRWEIHFFWYNLGTYHTKKKVMIRNSCYTHFGISSTTHSNFLTTQIVSHIISGSVINYTQVLCFFHYSRSYHDISVTICKFSETVKKKVLRFESNSKTYSNRKKNYKNLVNLEF